MAGSETEFDVAVIGGGIAGLVAANRAAELGLSVIVLERGEAQKYICNSRYTGGTFHISYNDVGKPTAELVEAIREATAGFARADVTAAIATDGIRLVRWLQSSGIRFMNLGQYHTFVLAPPSRTGPGLDWEGRAGDVMVDTLERKLTAAGHAIRRGHRARRIEKNEDGWTVCSEIASGEQAIRAKAVVIADGGFSSSLALVKETITDKAEALHQRNARTATGDGLEMARTVGAAEIKTDAFYGHLLSRDAFTNDKLWPRPYVDALAVAAIVVDGTGRRFADEGKGGVPLANAVAHMDDPLSASLVIDADIWSGPGSSPMIPANPHLPNVGGTMHRANTIRELAALMKVDADVLEQTVDTYNRALAGGATAALQPPRQTDHYKAMPIHKAPFYAIPVCSGITNTMAGIAVDGDGRVEDSEGQAIPGLYAAGSTTGGLEGGPATGYVGGLIKAVLGLRAAEAIARSLR